MMSEQIYFTREEAAAAVGLEVEAASAFPSVPEGTHGVVVAARKFGARNYVVEVRWNTPRPDELVDLMIWDVSFNFYRTRKSVSDEFSKSEFEALLRTPVHGQEASGASEYEPNAPSECRKLRRERAARSLTPS